MNIYFGFRGKDESEGTREDKSRDVGRVCLPGEWMISSRREDGFIYQKKGDGRCEWMEKRGRGTEKHEKLKKKK